MAEGRRILVVEDEEGISRVVADLLSDEGYAVRTAANGTEALALLRAWRPDAIVLDMMMPVMDGWAFRAAQRALPNGLAAIPIVVLSAARDAAAHAAALGAAAAIPKPFDLDDVLTAVARALGEGGAG